MNKLNALELSAANLSNQKAELNEQARKTLVTLIEQKFGHEPGFQSRASEALGVQQGNLSKFMRGKVPVPYKHLEALARLPDYAMPEREILNMNRERTHFQFNLNIPVKDYDRLKTVMVIMAGIVPVRIDNANVLTALNVMVDQKLLAYERDGTLASFIENGGLSLAHDEKRLTMAKADHEALLASKPQDQEVDPLS